jgi:hypothetical protein
MLLRWLQWVGRDETAKDEVSLMIFQIGAVIVAAAAAGAAAQYFLDQERGRTRRVRAKDQTLAAIRRPLKRTQREIQKKQSYVGDKLRGTAHELTSPDTPPETDRALVDKVRSEVLGQPRYSRYTINVDAIDGIVSLRGQLDHPEDIRDLTSAVRSVAGVRDVESFLHLPKTPPPNLQQTEDEVDHS